LRPNSTGADIRSLVTEAGTIAIWARRKATAGRDFLSAIIKL
jgi:ATP-dependent 26S proteasome regulatory subunit